MLSLIARLVSPAVSPTGARASEAGFVNGLLEKAGAVACSNPHQAQELREAAAAYMRVVR